MFLNKKLKFCKFPFFYFVKIQCFALYDLINIPEYKYCILKT